MRIAAPSSIVERGRAAFARMLPTVPEEMAGRVRMEQLVSILRLTPVMMGANIVIALLVCLAGLPGPHRNGLIIWAAVVVSYGLLGVRGWLAAKRRKGGKSTVSQRGVNRMAIQAGVLGCLWGVLPLMSMDGGNIQMRMLVASVIGITSDSWPSQCSASNRESWPGGTFWRSSSAWVQKKLPPNMPPVP